ncbi:hypothetical protein ACJJTC_005784 [Scirpophaga incertulas]
MARGSEHKGVATLPIPKVDSEGPPRLGTRSLLREITNSDRFRGGHRDGRRTRRVFVLVGRVSFHKSGPAQEWLKDLATERAREFFHVGKSALEESRTFKRELRATDVEQLSNLYELVLPLADSRQRHRLNLEMERTRAASEMLRVKRAHKAQLQRKREIFEQRLAQQSKDTSGTKLALEGV